MLNVFAKGASVFDLFDEMGQHVVSSTARLHALASGYPASLPEAQRIHEEEQRADEVAHRILNRLIHAFLPPMDREDIYDLTGCLDDIVDITDAVGRRFTRYRIQSVDAEFPQQTELFARAAVAVNDVVRRLRTSRHLSDLYPILRELQRLESAGDDNHHAALSRLFAGTSDPLFVLKWKEMFTLVEEGIDACQDVGNAIERIALKGA